MTVAARQSSYTGSASVMEATRVSSSPHVPAGDDEYLDRLFERAVELVENGRSVGELEIDDHHEHLLPAVERLLRLAQQVAIGQTPSLPSIPGFTILGELGHGGMGAVYLAKQEKLGGRLVALKMLPPAVAMSPHARSRFRAEALAIARLRHPHIVAVHDVVEERGLYAYAMEWIDGAALVGLIDHLVGLPHHPGMADITGFLNTTGSLEETSVPRFMCRVGIEIADALAAVHGEGLLHRDVKPSNVLLRRGGTALLSDFGLVRAADTTLMTQTGAFLGTPAYAAPEQLRGEHARLDARTDVYSLGATLYHALGLQMPILEQNTARILRRIEEGRVTPLRKLNPRVPRDLETIVAKAMAPEPERRYACAANLRDDLKRFVADEPIHARRASLLYRMRKRIKRHRTTSALLAALFLVLAVGAPLVWYGRYRMAAAQNPLGYVEPSGRIIAYETYRLQAGEARAGDAFGNNVAIEGDTIVIGAQEDPGMAYYAGSAYVYTFDGFDWIQQKKLFPGVDGRGSQFGYSIALEHGTLLIAAPASHEPEQGIYVFRRSGEQWTESARLWPGEPLEAMLYGSSVGVSGDFAAIGACAAELTGDQLSGAVWVHARDDHGTSHDATDDTWQLAARLEVSAQPPEWHTWVSLDGRRLAVGEPGSEGGPACGSVYVFESSADDVSAWRRVSDLHASDGQPGDAFGCQLDLDGERLAVGAKWADGVAKDSGAAYVFRSQNGQWVQETKLTASDPTERAQFGCSVALDDDLLLVGAHADSQFVHFGGAVYVFSYDGTRWVEVAKLRPRDLPPKSLFGYRIDVDGDRAVVGAAQENRSARGAAFVFGGLGDCNANGKIDLRDRVTGLSRDANANGICDECEPYPPRLARNTTGMTDNLLIGPPDDIPVCLGTAMVEFDFGERTVVDGDGPDLNVYEYESGRIEFDLIEVLVSSDGQSYVKLAPQEGRATRIPGDGGRGADQYIRSYDLAAGGVSQVRFVRIVGLGDGYGGDGAGMELDAIGAIHIRPASTADSH